MNSTLIKMAARNLRVNWKHSLAAILSLTSGFVALTMFENYFVRVKDMYRETYAQRSMFGSLLIEKRGAQEGGLEDQERLSLNTDEQAKVETMLGELRDQVTDRVRFLRVIGNAESGSNHIVFMGYGYDVAPGERLRGDAWKWNVNAGKPLAEGQEQLVLGKTLARNLGCKFDDKTTSFTAVGNYPAVERPFDCRSKISMSVTTDSGQMNALFMDVAGISDAGFAEIDARFAGMPLETAQKLLNTKRISMVSVGLKEGVSTAEVVDTLRTRSKEMGMDLEIRDWRDHPYGDLYVRTLDYLKIFRGFVMLVIILIVAMSVLNTFMKMVVERTAEIGTMRSFGFLPDVIVRLFAFEGFFLAGVGVAIGTVVAFFGSLLVNVLGVPYKAGILSEPVPFLVSLEPGVYGIVALFLCLIASATAVLSSWRQSRIGIPEALSS